ncbi:MAG TPA: hypothetical protein ENO14_00085 [Chromatiales bacterium]|nr:hypothetical protein [Chromatiales bacterium]
MSGASFLLVEPEPSGVPRPGRRREGSEYLLDTWLGDDLVRAHPAILVTKCVRDALEKLPDATGFSLVRARVKKSRFFRAHNRWRLLPAFWSVEVQGRAGRSDMGLTVESGLVVSERVASVLLQCRVRQATFRQYVGK